MTSRQRPGVEEHLDWAGGVASSVVQTVRGVSPLGGWSYSVWRPPQLRGLIDHLWAYAGPSSHRLKRVFPNGRVEILFNFGDAYRLVEGDGAGVCQSAWFCGPQMGPIVLEQPVHQHVIGVRLHPAGAYAIIARPLRETTGLSLDLIDIIGPEASELFERCAEATSMERRFEGRPRHEGDNGGMQADVLAQEPEPDQHEQQEAQLELREVPAVQRASSCRPDGHARQGPTRSPASRPAHGLPDVSVSQRRHRVAGRRARVA